jgi:hypothetical protein
MSEPFLGTIMPVGFQFAPSGWMTCQGQSLPISQYNAVFALLGTTFGGNGQTTFGLPKDLVRNNRSNWRVSRHAALLTADIRREALVSYRVLRAYPSRATSAQKALANQRPSSAAPAYWDRFLA